MHKYKCMYIHYGIICNSKNSSSYHLEQTQNMLKKKSLPKSLAMGKLLNYGTYILWNAK